LEKLNKEWAKYLLELNNLKKGDTMDDGSNDNEKSILRNRDHLFTFLTALIKRNGGQLIITEKEIMEVQKNDMVSVKYDPKQKRIIFEVEGVDLTSSYNAPDPNTRQDN
tara:strand:+ start:2382 stop:2708 length:327 start_codon:yes stop_codon:yes gene_type:complete